MIPKIHLKYDDGELLCCDNLEWMRAQPDNSVDLVFGSPPYEAQRTYRELQFNLTGDAWVSWMIERWVEMQRISRGLVAMVVEGFTKDFQWSATPALLLADLHRAGFKLRKPPIYKRSGIPGTTKEWLRNDYEFVICTSKGKMDFANTLEMGKPPKFGPGGDMTNRNKDGSRVNENRDVILVRNKDGVVEEKKWYGQPEIANPGNVIDCGAAGGGNMGCEIAHEGDAPFPEYLAEFFVRSFCPPGGTVLEPFCGSGTTVSVARQHHRRFIGIDIRESEIEKSQRRLQNGLLRQGFSL